MRLEPPTSIPAAAPRDMDLLILRTRDAAQNNHRLTSSPLPLRAPARGIRATSSRVHLDSGTDSTKVKKAHCSGDRNTLMSSATRGPAPAVNRVQTRI